MAYVANSRLYLRSMAELEARPIPGTDLGGYIRNPVFSPDGKSLAFFDGSDADDQANRRQRRRGGDDLPGGQYHDRHEWSEEGILFSCSMARASCEFPPTAASPSRWSIAKNNELLEGPQMLPGGQAVLFTLATGDNVSTAAWDKAQIVVQTLKSGARKVVLEGGSDARYLPTGHLVYALNGVLFAVPFNLKRLETTGGPVGIVEGIARGGTGVAQFAFSSTGSLIYIPGPVSASRDRGKAFSGWWIAKAKSSH